MIVSVESSVRVQCMCVRPAEMYGCSGSAGPGQCESGGGGKLVGPHSCAEASHQAVRDEKQSARVRRLRFVKNIFVAGRGLLKHLQRIGPNFQDVPGYAGSNPRAI